MVAYDAELPPVKKLLLIGLAESSGECPPSLLTGVMALAKWAGITTAEAVRIAGELQAEGWLDDEYRVVIPHRVRPDRPPAYAKRVLPAELRAAVFERDEFSCRHCGATENLTVDHIEAEVLGGTDELENLQTLCRSCNCRKGVKAEVPA